MDRDCENCIHKVNGACNVWECKFEPKSEIYRPCSKCHNEECVFMGSSDTHSLCEDFKPKFGTWIPVSERLPEKDKYADFYKCMVARLYTSRSNTCDICIAYFDGKRFLSHNSHGIVSGVRAWMPLPQPYKAEGSEE